MQHRPSKFPERRALCALVVALALVAVVLSWPTAARAQACCAGSGALTPGRLAMHEQALVGLQAKVGDVFGSYGADAHYTSAPAGATEVDLEQNVFGAVRFLRRGQVALLVPLVETHRQTRSAGSELGGGLGDVNLSARWDFVNAGQYRLLPGIGVLAGVTLPTGTPPESAGRPLATDATGVGAFQGNAGLALEQSFGPWLVNATAIVAKRAPRSAQGVSTTLGTQLTALAAVAYSFDNDAALALLASYSLEGRATVDGADVPKSGRRLLRVTGAGTYPLTDRLRLQTSLFFDPPIVHVGQNLPTSIGLTLAGLFTWS